jgi:hypothetical protein
MAARGATLTLPATRPCWGMVACSCGARVRIDFYEGLTIDDLPIEVRDRAEPAHGGWGYFVLSPCPTHASYPGD